MNGIGWDGRCKQVLGMYIGHIFSEFFCKEGKGIEGLNLHGAGGEFFGYKGVLVYHCILYKGKVLGISPFFYSLVSSI